MIFLVILSFTSPATNYLFPGLLKAIGAIEIVHVVGIPESIEDLIIFTELKKSLVVSRFDPQPPVFLSIALCPLGKIPLSLIHGVLGF